jgi:hypothetical protein
LASSSTVGTLAPLPLAGQLLTALPLGVTLVSAPGLTAVSVMESTSLFIFTPVM